MSIDAARHLCLKGEGGKRLVSTGLVLILKMVQGSGSDIGGNLD